MLTLMLLLAAEPAAAAAPAAAEASCSMIIEVDGRKSVTGPVAGLQVYGGPDALAVSPPAGHTLVGLMCHRASIVPDARDDRVFRQLGVPLYITTGQITGNLKLVDGAFVYRPVASAWDTTVQPQIDAVLAQFNARLGG